jgi:hypothetical protein
MAELLSITARAHIVNNVLLKGKTFTLRSHLCPFPNMSDEGTFQEFLGSQAYLHKLLSSFHFHVIICTCKTLIVTTLIQSTKYSFTGR